MERGAKKRHLPFLTSKARAFTLYGIDATDDEFIEVAYGVWREIGNIATETHRYFVSVPEDFIIELPVQVEFIQSVTLVDQPPLITSFDSSGSKDSNVFSYQESSNLPELNQSITSSPGKSVNYLVESSNTIRVTSPDLLSRGLMIVYTTIDTDKDGLPILNDKEVAAIAAETTKRLLFRKAFQGVGLKDKTTMVLLQTITQEADRLMASAKINENISDDAIDKLLDIKTTFDRKVFGSRKNLLD